MWKCKKCDSISRGSIYVSDGYCKQCDDYALLERFDPLNDIKQYNRKFYYEQWNHQYSEFVYNVKRFFYLESITNQFTIETLEKLQKMTRLIEVEVIKTHTFQKVKKINLFFPCPFAISNDESELNAISEKQYITRSDCYQFIEVHIARASGFKKLIFFLFYMQCLREYIIYRKTLKILEVK